MHILGLLRLLCNNLEAVWWCYSYFKVESCSFLCNEYTAPFIWRKYIFFSCNTLFYGQFASHSFMWNFLEVPSHLSWTFTQTLSDLGYQQLTHSKCILNPWFLKSRLLQGYTRLLECIEFMCVFKLFFFHHQSLICLVYHVPTTLKYPWH